jgi:hypothetical protein
MRTIYSIAILFTLSVVLCGCPWWSDVGLDEKPSINIDPALLGTWHDENYPGVETEIIFTKLTAQVYSVKARVWDGDENYENLTGKAWFSEVNKVKLLVLHDTKADSYWFAEISRFEKEMAVTFLSASNKNKEYTSTADLRKYMESLYTTKKIKYDGDTGLVKLKKEAE